jgi:zinc protease
LRGLDAGGVGALCAGGVAQTSAFWPSESPPRPLQAHEVKIPPYEVRTLANGLQVVAVAHHEQPAVTMRLLIRAGAAQDPERKRGVASLTAALLDQGTTSRSAQQIADQIDSIGGALSTGSGMDLTSVDAVVMKDSFDLAMDLVADVVRNPAFSPEEIDRQKEQTISSLRVNAGDPDYVASSVFTRLVYGFHPYAMPGVGTPESIASLTAEDLRAFHRQYFVPNNMILAIVGDITNENAFAAAERVFGRWAARRGAALGADRASRADAPHRGSRQTRRGANGSACRPAGHPAQAPRLHLLGPDGEGARRRGANRLHRVLRSERGLTYGAEADTVARKHAGNYFASTDTRTETTGEVRCGSPSRSSRACSGSAYRSASSRTRRPILPVISRSRSRPRTTSPAW